MFFVIFSVTWSSIQITYNRDLSNILLFLIVWGWYLDVGVYYHRWKILTNIVKNNNIISFSILNIGVNAEIIDVKVIDLSSPIVVIFCALLIGSIADRTPLWKNREKILITGMQFSAIGAIGALIVDIYYKNNINENKQIIMNINTLPFFLIINIIIYAPWCYYETKSNTK